MLNYFARGCSTGPFVVENKFKTFHFREINFFVSFPVGANAGKYADYEVYVAEGESETPSKKKTRLREFLELARVDQNYPHTVGYFKMSLAGGCLQPEYLELREIRSIEEFWLFLNAVNL